MKLALYVTLVLGILGMAVYLIQTDHPVWAAVFVALAVFSSFTD